MLHVLFISFPFIPGHPWVAGDQASDKPLGAAVLGRIKNFSAANNMKKLALKVNITLRCPRQQGVHAVHACRVSS